MFINFKIAWRNIWRNPRRAAITMSAIFFATAFLVFMLSWQLGTYNDMINASVKIHTGHMQIQAKDYNKQGKIWQVISDPSTVATLLKPIADIKAYTLRANCVSVASTSHNSYGVMVIGINPKAEANVSNLKSITHKGSYFTDGQSGNQILIGDILAKNLNVELGDQVTILGQGRDGSIAATVGIVKGIYKSGLGEFDRSTIHMPLKTFQTVYSMGKAVNEITILCKSLDDVSFVKNIITSKLTKLKAATQPLVVLDWSQLLPGVMQTIQLDNYLGLILYFILIVVVIFTIFNTFLMSIFERTREFGIFMALGTTPTRLARLLVIESMMMTVIGIVAGIIIGCLITLYFQIYGLVIPGQEAVAQQYGLSGSLNPQLSWFSALAGPCVILVMSFIASLYPVIRLRKLNIVSAMKVI